MGKGKMNMLKNSKKIRQFDDQNYGKVGRPKKKKENGDLQQEIDKQQWFNVSRALHMLTLICEKGSLALRYKTGQRSTQIDDHTKNKKSEETRKLKVKYLTQQQQKLKELKKFCNYDEKQLYLLIDNNSEAQQFQENISDQDGIIEDMNKIYKYLHKDFQVTFSLILKMFLEADQNQDKIELAHEIINKIIATQTQHTMLTNLALIKTNIEDDLEYVLKLANSSNCSNFDKEVDEKWIKDDNKIKQWMLQFIIKVLQIFTEERQ